MTVVAGETVVGSQSRASILASSSVELIPLAVSLRLPLAGKDREAVRRRVPENGLVALVENAFTASTKNFPETDASDYPPHLTNMAIPHRPLHDDRPDSGA
jgi:hypothetical protein